MVIVYQLCRDKKQIESVQHATLNTEEFGYEQTHALFGTPEWWRKIDTGELALHRLQGHITEVYMGSMGDWPEFTMRTESGDESRWTRYANTKEQYELYTVGLRIELDYVVQRFKSKAWWGGGDNKCVIEVRLDHVA